MIIDKPDDGKNILYHVVDLFGNTVHAYRDADAAKRSIEGDQRIFRQSNTTGYWIDGEPSVHADVFTEAFNGSFLRPVIEQGNYYAVETDAGTEIVPSNVSGHISRTVKASDLAPYVSGGIYAPEDEVTRQYGWLARMSAPGYTDCTDWSAHPLRRIAMKYLMDTYGNE